MVYINIMRELNLRTIDLNLLTALEALFAEAHVTNAAMRAGMSQPAMSRALGRLRRLLNDPILVRGPSGYVLTARAQGLKPRLAVLLGDVRALVTEEEFDPRTLVTVLTIASTDHQTIMLLPRLMARLSKEAPRVDVRVVPFVDSTLDRMMDGTVDLAFGVGETMLPPMFKRQALYRDRFVTLVRKGHPAAGSMSVERFVSLDHVLVTIFDDGRGAMDAVLAARGLTRRIALRLPHFFAAISIVAVSDLVVTLPMSIASRFAADYGLVILEPPIERPAFEVVSMWSEAVDRDPAARFLRGIVREEARKIEGVMPL